MTGIILAGSRVVVIEPAAARGTELCAAISEAGGVSLGPFPDVWEALECLRSNLIDAALVTYRSDHRDTAVLAHSLAAGGKPVLFCGAEPPPDALIGSSSCIGACPPDASATDIVAQLSLLIGPRSGAERAVNRSRPQRLLSLIAASWLGGRAHPVAQRL